jgi:hypothetical protein
VVWVLWAVLAEVLAHDQLPRPACFPPRTHLNAVHELGHPRGDVVVAVEADRAVRDGLARLRVRAGDGDAEGGEALGELREQPRAGREAADEPDGADRAAARGDLRADGVDGGGDARLEERGDLRAGELELARADADGAVAVERRAERDVLRLVRVPEQPLRRLVEAARDVVERVRGAVPAVRELAREERARAAGDEDRAGEDAWAGSGMRTCAATGVLQSGGAISSMTSGEAPRMA